MDCATTALAVPTHAYPYQQIGHFENNGALEAAALQVNKTGFFSICFRTPETIKEAERQNYLLYDLKDYETRSESWGELRARNSGYSSLSARIEEIESQLDKRARFALRQRSYPVSVMTTVIGQLFKRSDFAESDLYITQNTFSERNRRTTNLLHLNALYVDLDIDKSNHWSKKLTRTKQGEVFADWCQDNNIPLSIILHSGGGLHCKIWFQTSVSSMAKPIWDAMEKKLIERIKQGGWPVDESVCDVSRILRINESYNQKNGNRVDVVWVNGTKIEDALRYDFNWLADSKTILPYTREEVCLWKKEREFWAENKRIALSKGMNGSVARQIKTLCEKELWNFRLDVIRRYVIANYPHGVPLGKRNNFAFLVALALAWTLGKYDQYINELENVIEQICPSLSRSEISQSAHSVTKKIIDGNKEQYKYTDEKIYSFLEIPMEFVQKVRAIHGIGGGRDRSKWDVGVMGFVKMENLSVNDYIQETKKRQRLASYRTNEIQKKHNADNRNKACELEKKGMSNRDIAMQLGVSKSSVNRWLK